MNITIRVASKSAIADLARVSAADRELAAQFNRSAVSAAASSSAFGNSLHSMSKGLAKWGSQTQYVGRQLMYNFTLPLVIAGGAAVKWALDNETALVRVKKVYGDATHSATFYKKEIVSLDKAFEALSNQFGISRAETTNIAADWAAAGSSGLALAKATKLTMETMILGEMNAVDATKALISIQAQYGQTVAELSVTIDTLNMIENQTGVSMQGLIDGFQRSAGVARAAGIDVEHLGAMMAALVPSAGSAAQAGNAIKTIISRILSPTKEATQVLGLMGVSVKDVAWQSMNGSQRLELLAVKFNKLSDAQKIVVSTTLGSRFQMNKLIVLLNDLNNKTGYYRKSLESTADANANLKQKTSELNAVLESNPQKLKQIWTILKNAMTDVVQPMIPFLILMAGMVTRLFTSFNNLNPSLQKFIGVSLLVVALAGPIVKYLGAFATLIGYLGIAVFETTRLFGRFGLMLLRIAASPFKLIWSGIMMIDGAISKLVLRLGGPIKAAWAAFIGLFTTSAAPVATLAAEVDATNATIVASTAATTSEVSQMWAIASSSIRKEIGAAQYSAANLPVYVAVVISEAAATVTAGAAAMAATIEAENVAAATVVDAVWISGTANLTQVFVATATGIISIWGTFTTTLLEISTATNTGVVAIWQAASTDLVLLSSVTTSKVLAVWVATSTELVVIWNTMSTELVVISAAAGAEIVLVWSTVATELALRVGSIVVAFSTAVDSLLFFETVASTMPLAIGASATIIEGEWWAMAGGIAAANQMIAISAATTVAEVTTVATVGATGLLGFFTGIAALIGRTFGIILGFTTKLIPWILRALISPWGIALVALIGVLYHFRDRFVSIWNGIVAWFQSNATAIAGTFAPLAKFFNSIVNGIETAFWRLPVGIQSAFMTVVDIVRRAALQVREWMSYLNPFQRHSPSLVDNVKKGMAVVKDEHKAVGKANPLSSATTHLAAYSAASSNLSGSGGFADELANVTKSLPSMLPLFKLLLTDLASMNSLLAIQKAAVDAQQAVVDGWQVKLDAANKTLDAQTTILDGLQKKLDALTNAYDAHKTAMQDFANTPIVGMKAMNDAIWANDMAQKQLQLDIMNAGGGESIDSLRNKYAKLQGDIESLTATQKDLRMSGAGSDVTGAYADQIKALQAQQKAVAETTAPLQSMQDQLTALQTAAQKMNLEKDLKFGPLTKQVDDLANGMKELPFDQILAGVKNEAAAMAALQPQIDAATAAVDRQKAVVDSATRARDAISAAYDIENAKLKTLNDTYAQTEKLVRDIESALHDMGSAASSSAAKAAAKSAKSTVLSPGAQNFVDSAKGNFPDVGGTGKKIGREGGIADQSKLIDQWVKDNTTSIGDSFAKIDMFKPIKDMWNKVWAWIVKTIGPTVSNLVNALKKTWDSLVGLDLFGGSSIVDGVTKAFDAVTSTVKGWWNNGIKPIIDLFAPDFKQIWDVIVSAGKRAWNQIGPAAEKFGEIFKDIIPALENIWKTIKPIVMIIGGGLLFALKMAASIIANVFGPVLNFLIDTLTNVINFVRGFIQIIISLFAGDFTGVMNGIKAMFGAVWDEIIVIFKTTGGILWGIVKGIVSGIIGFFKYLWDMLVGHSIIPDMINTIVKWFRDLGPWVINHVKALIDGVIGWFKTLPDKVWSAVILIKDKLGLAISTAFTLMKNKAIAGWTVIVNWMKGIPQAAWGAIISIKDKLTQAASDAFGALLAKAKSLVDGKGGFMAFITGIPGRVGAGFAKIGSIVANSVMNAWNGAANWINKNGIGNINKVTTHFGFTLLPLPHFATGGIVGGAPSKRDNTLIAVRSGEGIIVPEAVRALGGARGINALNSTTSSGGDITEFLRKSGLPGFEGGGIWGSITGVVSSAYNAVTSTPARIESLIAKGAGLALNAVILPLAGMLEKVMPGKSFMEQFMATTIRDWAAKAKTWGDKRDATAPTGGDSSAHGSSAAANQAIARNMLNLYGFGQNQMRSLIPLWNGESGWNQFASNGNSGPDSGSAYGIPQSLPGSKMASSGADWRTNPATQIAWGLKYIRDRYGSPDSAFSTWQGRSPHWYDDGGWMKPGQGGMNGSSKPEPVFTASQWTILSNLVSMSANVLKSAVMTGSGVAPGLRGATLLNAQGTMTRNSTTSTLTPSNSGGVTEIHFHGDLVMPNIRTGDDAKAFIKNLESLVG